MHFTTRFWFASQPQKWTLHKYKPNASVHFYYLPHFQLNQPPSKKKKTTEPLPNVICICMEYAVSIVFRCRGTWINKHFSTCRAHTWHDSSIYIAKWGWVESRFPICFNFDFREISHKVTQLTPIAISSRIFVLFWNWCIFKSCPTRRKRIVELYCLF